jgi:hypothetical protein
MAGDPGRPQDQGRKHRARRAPAAATSSLLTRYYEAMRAELAGTLAELEGAPAPAGLLPDVTAVRVRPSLGDRMKLWELAMKLGRELGAELDVNDTPADQGEPDATPTRTRKRRPDFGGA